MATGLVLGAGGAKAWIFHLGVLETLEESGFQADSADLIVGTSAGASIAAGVRAGLGVDELYRAVTRPPSEDDRRQMVSELRVARKTLRPLAPRLAREAIRNGRGTTLALAGVLPPGLFPTGWLASFPGMDRFAGWPDGLWVPAIRVSDGELVVFGRDRRDLDVHVAVQASSAVPGMFQPTYVDGVPHVDGGVVSSTHADLLIGQGVDRVIISAPMSRPSGRLFARNARRRLTQEVDRLHRAGMETLVVEPPPGFAEVARGYPRRRPDAAPAITERAVEATRLALAVA